MAGNPLTLSRPLVAAYLNQLRKVGLSHVRLQPGWKEKLEDIPDGEEGAGKALKEVKPAEAVPEEPSRDIPAFSKANRPTDPEEALKELEAQVRADTRIRDPFQYARNLVFGTGNPQASILFVGEAPGADEDEAGEPFVGKAGQLLTKMIEAMGLSRSEVYIANIVKYRPDMPPGSPGNRKPTPDEMKLCLPILLEQIDIIQPEVMVTLGATAVEGLFDIPRAGMTRLRGKWKTFRDIPVMPTFHPAYLLREESFHEKRKVWEDLMEVMEKTGMPISEKQRNYFVRHL